MNTFVEKKLHSNIDQILIVQSRLTLKINN